MHSAVLAIGLLLLFAVLRISRRFDARADRDVDRYVLPGLQFELTPDNPESKAMFRFLGAMALVSLVATTVLFVLASPIQAIIPVVITGPLALVATWRFSRYFRGTAEIGSNGIDVRTSGRTLTLRWEHIRSIDIRTFRSTRGGDALFATLTRAGIDEPFVRVKLNRSLRIDTLAGLAGPAVAGVPTGIRQCRIWPTDPEAFIRLAQPYLPEPEPALATASNTQPSSSV